MSADGQPNKYLAIRTYVKKIDWSESGMSQSAGTVCIGTLHTIRCWVVRASTCASRELPTQFWITTEVISRR